MSNFIFVLGEVGAVQHVVSLFLPNLHLEFKLLLTSSQLSEEWDLFLSFLFLTTCSAVYLFRVLTAFVSGQLRTDGLATLASTHCFFVSSSSLWLSPCRLSLVISRFFALLYFPLQNSLGIQGKHCPIYCVSFL